MTKVSRTEIMRIEGRCSVLVEKAHAIVISSAAGETHAYEMLKDIKKHLSIIENKRKAITGPLNQSLRETNDMFKKLSGPLTAADTIIRTKIVEFRTAEEERAAKEQEKREKIQEAHKQKGHKTHELVPVVADAGDSVVQKRWTYSIIDILKVPRKYLQLDSAAVRTAIGNGAREIAGLKIYQEASVSVRG